MSDFPIILPALPEIVLALAGMGLLMAGVFSSAERANAAVTDLALAALAVVIGLVMIMSGPPVVAFNGMFATSAFGAFVKVLVLAASMLAIVMGRDYMARETIDRFEYPVLIVFSALGMMMMISANTLIALYLGLELQSLCLYVIAAFHRDSLRSTEAGLKYFVLGALSSGMMLYGASIVYGFTGATGFPQIAEVLAAGTGATPVGVIIGLVFVIAGLAFKISAVPFHMWTPDVYEGAPTPVTAFFAVAPKLAAFALLLRVMLEPFGPLVDEWRQIIVLVSIGSMILGAFAAISQTNIKRLMAYSSIGHVGYALIGLAAGTETGVRGVLIYLAIYLVMNIGTFACILSMRRHGDMVEGIGDLAGLSTTSPRMALALTVFLFSLAGIPPLAGFFGKLYVLMAAIDAGLYTLALIGVLASVVGAYYYLRIIKIMYFDPAAEPFDRPSTRTLGVIMTVAAVVIAAFIVFPEPLVNSAGRAAAALFAG